MSRLLAFIAGLFLIWSSAASAQDAGAAAQDAAERPTAATPTGPSAVITALNATLLEVMRQAAELGYEGRYAKLSPILQQTFDYAAMSRISVGRHWRKLTPTQRQQLVETFTRMSKATFAARFNGYSGERFEVLGEEPGLRNSVLVRSRILQADGNAIPLDYQFRNTKGGWRAVDVYLDAKFSELATRRAEYGAILSREGFDSLIATLEGKIAALQAG